MSTNKKILVLDGNSSQCLPVIRSLNKSGYKVSLVCPGIFSAGYFSRYVHKRIIWPKIKDDKEKFYTTFLNHIKGHRYELVLGLGDHSTAMLSYHKREIEQFVKTIVPDFDIYSLAADKYQTMLYCMENNVPCPYTIEVNQSKISEFDEQLRFPVVVKPRKGVGAVGFTVVKDQEALNKRLPLLQKEFGDLLIQEYIPNKIQYTAEVFCDHKSEMKVCVISEKTRFFPVNGGSSSCNITVKNKEIYSSLEKILKKIKWAGIANIDLIYDPRDQTAKIIEINPRIGATVKIAFVAGIDIANKLIQFANNESVYKENNYKEGIALRNMILDILWFLFSSRESKQNTKPSFYNFFNRDTYYQTFRLDDPFPFVGFLISNIMKYSNIDTIKRKLGLKIH